MGYTHYWYRPRELDAAAFAAFAEDARDLTLAWEGPIAWDLDYSDEPPTFTPESVRFNGVGSDGHETFIIARTYALGGYVSTDADGRLFDCCKTARKPYDALVCAVLIAFKHRFGDAVRVTSDGNWDGCSWYGRNLPEWRSGRALYRRVFPNRGDPADVLAAPDGDEGVS